MAGNQSDNPFMRDFNWWMYDQFGNLKPEFTQAGQMGATRGAPSALEDNPEDDPWNDPTPDVPPPPADTRGPAPDPRYDVPPGNNQWGIPVPSPNPASYDRDLSYWLQHGVTPTGPEGMFDANGQLRPGWQKTARGYERTGSGTTPPIGSGDTSPTNPDYHLPGDNGFKFGGASNPNANFSWPTLSLPRANYPDFPGFKNFQQPTQDEILNDPVLQAQLKEGNNRIKQDRAFRGILNTGDTLKDIFDWTSDRIKLGGHDAFDRAFKVYDVNDRQNPFNTWSANKDKYFQTFNANTPAIRDEFDFNQFRPAEALWRQNYDQWAKTGDWLSNAAGPPE